MDQLTSMAVARRIGIENSYEHKFARDIIRFVLRQSWPGLQWKPTGIFLEQSLDSPFTPQFCNAVMKESELRKNELRELYEKYLPDENTLKDTYYEILTKCRDGFVNGYFHPKYFVSFSVLVAKFAVFAYNRGFTSAPEQSYRLLVSTVRECKRLGKFTDEAWVGMQDWLDVYCDESTESASENEYETDDSIETVKS